MVNNISLNINLKTEYKKLRLFTILMILEAEMPTILIIDPYNNIYWKVLSSLLYIPAIISVISYKYNKNLIKYRIYKYNNISYKNAIKYRTMYLIIPAIIYFIISPLIFIITKNTLYFTLYEIIGFIIFILDELIINKRVIKSQQGLQQ